MEFVYANVDGLSTVLYAPTRSMDVTQGDIWYADDPFVVAHPEMFSSTPVVVRSTTGRPERLDPTPLEVAKRKALGRRG